MAALKRFVADTRTAVTNVYGKQKVPELVALAEKKIRANANMQVVAKLEERRDACRDGLEKLSVQIEQIQAWVTNNFDECTDIATIEGKKKWLAGYAEKAFYNVDRAIYEWTPKRERGGEGGDGTATVATDNSSKGTKTTAKAGTTSEVKGRKGEGGAGGKAKAVAATMNGKAKT